MNVSDPPLLNQNNVCKTSLIVGINTSRQQLSSIIFKQISPIWLNLFTPILVFGHGVDLLICRGVNATLLRVPCFSFPKLLNKRKGPEQTSNQSLPSGFRYFQNYWLQKSIAMDLKSLLQLIQRRMLQKNRNGIGQTIRYFAVHENCFLHEE